MTLKVKGKVRKPTPAMQKVLDEMKAGERLVSFQVSVLPKKSHRFFLGSKEVSASTVIGLVDRYLIQETNFKSVITGGDIDNRSEYVLTEVSS